MSQPQNLSPCDPCVRTFPKDWKEAYFRRHYDEQKGGYVCPDCGLVFRGPSGFRGLHADHMIPMSRGGQTVWENLTLRCGPCNLWKGNKLANE